MATAMPSLKPFPNSTKNGPKQGLWGWRRPSAPVELTRMKISWLFLFLLLSPVLAQAEEDSHLVLGNFSVTIPGEEGEEPFVIRGDAQGVIVLQMGSETKPFGQLSAAGLFENQQEGIAIQLQTGGDFWLPKEKQKIPVRIDPDGTLQMEGRPMFRVQQGKLTLLDEEAPVPDNLQLQAAPGTDRMLAFILGILVLTM